jgi:hypothetical protein
MTAIAKKLFHTIYSAREVDPLTQLILFCGVGLLVSLLAMTYGLDLSPGFF